MQQIVRQLREPLVLRPEAGHEVAKQSFERADALLELGDAADGVCFLVGVHAVPRFGCGRVSAGEPLQFAPAARRPRRAKGFSRRSPRQGFARAATSLLRRALSLSLERTAFGLQRVAAGFFYSQGGVRLS